MIFRTCSGGISSLAGSTYPNFLVVPYLFAFNACHLRAVRDNTTNTIHIHPSVSRASHITREQASSRASDDCFAFAIRARAPLVRPSLFPYRSLHRTRTRTNTHAPFSAISSLTPTSISSPSRASSLDIARSVAHRRRLTLDH